MNKVADKAGRDQAHGAAMELKRARVDIEKVGKTARDDATKFQKAVISKEKELIFKIEPSEIHCLGLRDAWDAEEERIKREKEEKERARLMDIQARIEKIKDAPRIAAMSRTADVISGLLQKLKETDMQGFDEFEESAKQAFENATKEIELIFEEHKKEEEARAQEEAEAKRLREDQEAEAKRLQAEAEKLRKEKEAFEAAKAAEEKKLQDEANAEAKRLQEERKAFEAEQAAFKAQQEAAAKKYSDEKQVYELPIAMVYTQDAEDTAKPSDEEIVAVLADYYAVEATTVIKWIGEMDLINATKDCVGV